MTRRSMLSPRDRIRSALCAAGMVGCVAVGALVMFGWPAKGHEAPLGWTYPWACCSSQDCKQAAEGDVRETRDGYRIVSTGEIVPYQDKRVKDSPDGFFHTCQQAGDFDKGRVLCLFRPARGF